MESEFWLERWEKGEIGFHQSGTHHFLEKHSAEAFFSEDKVLVPLCGKTLDMLYLSGRVKKVFGIELSQKAVTDFFSENSLEAIQVDEKIFRAGNISLYCGDFFDFDAETFGRIDSVYDRAALVALPESMRRKYARRISSLLPSGGRMLLVTFEFGTGVRQGPPFSISPDAVKEVYENDFQIRLLDTDKRTESRFGEILEHCFLLTRH